MNEPNGVPNTKSFTRKNITDWISRKLGHPVVRVELTPEQIDDCIDDALSEISPWVVQRQFVTVDVAERIDLSEHDVSFVIAVHKATPNQGAAGPGSSVDVFNPYTYSYYYSTSGNTPSIYETFQNTLYAGLEQQLYKQMSGYLKDNISFKYIRPYLYLDIGIPPSSKVTVEYSAKVLDVDSIEDELYQDFVKKFALAYARILLADIRGKFDVAGAPIRLDGDRQESRGSSELDRLRQLLKDTVDTHFMLD